MFNDVYFFQSLQQTTKDGRNETEAPGSRGIANDLQSCVDRSLKEKHQWALIEVCNLSYSCHRILKILLLLERGFFGFDGISAWKMCFRQSNI